MGQRQKPALVCLFIGLIYRLPETADAVQGKLVRRFGETLLESQPFPFEATDYYTREMGPDLRRRFIAFRRLIPPERLAAIKLWTNRLEHRYTCHGKRAVNLDPGWLDEARVALATTKDFSHRLCLRPGVYAEITLLFTRQGVRLLDWTYPDYRNPEYQAFFRELRRRYRLRKEEGGPRFIPGLAENLR